MAVAELIAFTTGRDDSSDQTIPDGGYHTLIPRFNGRPGKVEVSIATSDVGDYWKVKSLSSRSTEYSEYQLRGPLTYRVSVRNAGVDVDDGA